MKGRTTTALFWLVVVVALVGALAIRLWGITFGWGQPLARPDEDTILLRAVGILTGHADYVEALRVGWPSGFMRLAAGVFWIEEKLRGNIGCQFVQAPGQVYLGLRLLSAFADVVTAVVVGRIAQHLASEHKRAAFLAGVLAYGSSYLAIREAHFGTTNSVENLLIALCLLNCVSGRLLTAGLMAGLAFGVKYSGITLLAPLAVACWKHKKPFGWTIFIWLFGVSTASPDIFAYPMDFFSGFSGVSSRYGAGMAAGLIDPSAAPPSAWAWFMGTVIPVGLGCWTLSYLALIEGTSAILGAHMIVVILTLLPLSQLFVRYACPFLPAGAAMAAIYFATRLHWILGGIGAAMVVLGLVLAFEFDHLLAQPDTRDLAAAWVKGKEPATSLGGYTRPALLDTTCTAGTSQSILDAAYRSPSAIPPGLVLVGRPLLANGRLGRKEVSGPPENCVRVADFSPGWPSPQAKYDPFDMFFVPFTGFAGLTNPGPLVEVYNCQ